MYYPKVSLLVLTWNEKDILTRCIKSIEAIDYPNYEVIVIDNGSKDGTATMIKEKFSNVQLVEVKENVGPAEGANYGIRYALKNMPDYIFFTTNDTVLDKDILKELVKVAESDEKIGIVGPTVYWTEYPERIQNAGRYINWTNGTVRTQIIQEGISEVDYLEFILLKSSIIREIGLYNSKYFAYWEDADLCTRIKKAGYKVVCIPKAKIWHSGSYTTKKLNGFREYQLIRNNFWFMKRHARRVDYFKFILYNLTFRIWFLSGMYLIKHRNFKVFAASLKGFSDGIMEGL